MAVDFNINIKSDGIADVLQEAQSRALDNDAQADDPAEAARKKIAKKVALKKNEVKQKDVQRETFSRDGKVQQKMQQVLGGAEGPEAADALRSWDNNKGVQKNLTEGQRQLFREAMAKNPPKATKAALAMERLSQEPAFKEVVKGPQQMGALQKGLIDQPGTEKAASEMLKNRFMKSIKSDAQTKNKFMEFGMKQAGKGRLDSMRRAGDLLNSVNDGKIGRSGQRASMKMMQRTGADPKAMSQVDQLVKDPHFSKLPNFARTKGTELLAKSNGDKDVGDGFKSLAKDPKFKTQTAQNKGRFFSTIGSGRSSEYRPLTDKLLGSLQNADFPKREGQVQKFLSRVSTQAQARGAGGVDTKAAIRNAKSSPMPTLSLVKIDPETMDEDTLRQARSKNRANVMQYHNKMTRMFEGVDKKLKSARYLEDVNSLPTLREPPSPDLSSLSPEERAFIEERHAGVLKRYKSLSSLYKQRSRELRTKRRRGGKKAEHQHRAKRRPVRYYTLNQTRSQPTSQAFLQGTGTDGGPQGLPRTPTQGRARQASQKGLSSSRGGASDIQSQVAQALSQLGTGPMTPQKVGQVAQSIAQQVSQEVVREVTQSLLGAMGSVDIPESSPSEGSQALQSKTSSSHQKGKVDGWGIPRSFERDLGGVQAPVQRPVQGDEPTLDQVAVESYKGRQLIKDPSAIRELMALFATIWKDLSKPEQALLKNLGWNQHLWATKNSPAAKWPGAMVTPFVNLNPVQREAARKLGFTPHDWDAKVQAFASGRNA
jgi:hypothetical protein